MQLYVEKDFLHHPQSTNFSQNEDCETNIRRNYAYLIYLPSACLGNPVVFKTLI
jgi:hypothetical protein